MFTQLFMTTTKTRKKKVTTMTEQTKPLTNNVTVQSHLPDITLISRDAYWNDLKSRVSIHNHEINAALKELKDTVEWTKTTYKNIVK